MMAENNVKVEKYDLGFTCDLFKNITYYEIFSNLCTQKKKVKSNHRYCDLLYMIRKIALFSYWLIILFWLFDENCRGLYIIKISKQLVSDKIYVAHMYNACDSHTTWLLYKGYKMDLS